MTNLDHSFDSRLREEFGQLDVRFNEAHWNRLDAALSAAAPPPSFFRKHRRVILLLFLLLLTSAVLLWIYMPLSGHSGGKMFSPGLHRLNVPLPSGGGKSGAGQPATYRTQTQTQPNSLTNEQNAGTPVPALVPALSSTDSVAQADSIAAKLKADSLQLLKKKKKKVHLIW
ncbi:MAG: hypothetical protein MUC87_17475 [Bacteroidia bacterium]|jgi:hypothetical protein|nr:hypothetical protein [Bacteroidia bacterium]